MDAAQLQGLLKSYGAADTPENVQRIQSHYASDPTAMDRRLFGAKGQSDESGGSRDAILNAMLDKVIVQTSATPVATPAPEVSPMVQNASLPSKRSATANAPNRRQLSNSSPNSGDPLADEVNKRTPANPNAMPPRSVGVSSYEVDPQTSAQNGPLPNFDLDGILPLILGLVGAGAAAKPVYNAVGKRIAPTTPPEASYAGPMNKNIMSSGDRVTKTDRIGQGQHTVEGNPVSDLVTGNKSAGAIEQNIKLDNQAPSKVENSPELVDASKRQQTQQSIDAANAEYDSMLRQQILEQIRGKRNLKGAVRNASGRK